MANKYKGEVAVQAFDKAWVLRFGMNELIEAQEALGYEGADDGFLPWIGDQIGSMRFLRTVVCCALKFAHPEMTEDQAGKIVTAVGLREMGAAVYESLLWAMPEKEKGGTGPGKGAAGSRGVSS